MPTTRRRESVHIAVDTNVIIALSIYEKYGDDLRKMLKFYSLDSEEVKNIVMSNDKLRKEFYDPIRHRISERLDFVYELYYQMRKGNINLHITKTVAGELGIAKKTLFKDKVAGRMYSIERDVLSLLENPDNNLSILTVKDEDAAQFAQDKLELASAYVEARAMDKEYNSQLEDYYPCKDADIVAEASLFGLFLVTLNEKHFIHIDANAENGLGDFERANRIEKVNGNYDLYFPTNRIPHKDPPRPISLASFMTRYNLRARNNRLFYTKPNINDNDEIEYNPLVR